MNKENMKLNQLPSDEEFLITKHNICGDELNFIRPRHTYFDWVPETLQFRSSVWGPDGNLVSAGFKKFFNLEEKPTIDPFDGNIEEAECIEKLDGSLLIVSSYRDVPILRTRGSFDTISMPNHFEMAHFLEKELKPLLGDGLITEHSFLFEWQSPSHQVVIKHEAPKLTLLGIVQHSTYEMWTQDGLDRFAEERRYSRPQRFAFRSKGEMLQSIAALEGQEGICLYYNNGQNIRKVKSTWYLKLHAFRSECSPKTIANLYLEKGRPTQETFETIINDQFDYECLIMAKPFISQLYSEAVHPVEEWTSRIIDFTSSRKEVTQKDYALELLALTEKNSDLAGIGFAFRKGIDPEKNIAKCILNKMGL